MSLLKNTLTWLFCVFTSLTLSAQDASELLQNREYKEAVELLKGDLKDDNLLLLRARAQFLGGQFEDAIATTKKLSSEHPKSEWLHKAHFIQAQAHSKLRRYDQASGIFEKEAETLLSPSYKDKGAKLLMEVAAKFSYIPKTTELNKSRADVNKAVRLLNEALSLNCSITMKESILSELVSLHVKIENWQGAITYSLLYLDQFDPDWKGALNSTARVTFDENKQREVKLVGLNRGMVRFHLSEAYHRSGKRVEATRYLTEFIAELKKANIQKNQAILADATWLRLMALREKGGRPRNLQSWITEVKTYLQTFPNHIHAQATAYAIAHAYLSYGEEKNAITSFQDYIDNYHGKFIEKPLTARPENKQQLLARQNQANSRFELAHYEIGKTYLQLNEFEQAKQAWKLYSTKFSNGVKWAECQKGLVDIDFSIATHAVELIQNEADKKSARDAAQKALNDFITKYPLDSRIATALYLTGNIPYQHAEELGLKLKKSPAEALKKQQLDFYQAALKNWNVLTTKYPRSSHAVQAQYLSAFVHEEHLGDIEKALEIYAKSSHTNASRHVRKLKAKNLIASSDTTFTTTEKPHITLSTRNIKKVTVQQYWLDVESYFRKARKLEDVSALDIDLIEADKTWEITLPNYKKYYTMDSQVDIPFPANKAGICVIKVESKTFSSTTLVVRSNIDIAVRSNKEEVITYAHLAGNENRPAGNTQVLIADGGKIIATGKTDNQGIFHYRNESLAEVNDLRVLALSDTGAATCALNLSNLRPARKLTPKVWFNLAKTEYLPGETIEIGGVVRFPADDTAKNVYVSPTQKQRNYTLSIKQSNSNSNSNKLLYKKKITTSATGVFQHSYQLPSYLSHANLTIHLKPDFDDELPAFNHFFGVSQDAEPMVTLKLEMDKKWTTDESILNGKIIASYRWGAAFADRQITVTLPNKRSLKIRTDAKGEATFRYDSQFDEPGNVIQFSATTLEQEYYTNTVSVLIDPINFSILASTDFASAAAGQEVTLTAKTILPDETPISRELKLEVLQIINVKQNPILITCRGLEHLTKLSTREKIIQTTPLTTDVKTGKIEQKLNFDKAGRYLIRLSSQDSKGREVIARSYIDVHDTTSQRKLIIFTDKRGLEVGKTATINTYSYFKSPAKALLTVETDKIIEKRIITLNPGKNDIPLKLITAHAPVVRVNLMAIYERKFHTVSDTIPVVNKLTLKVTTKKVELSNEHKKFDYKAMIQALDANGNPVAADFFVNLTHRSNETPAGFNDYSRLTQYSMRSNCGLVHKGRQNIILTEIRDELQRMEQGQTISRVLPNIPASQLGSSFYSSTQAQTHDQLLSQVDQSWELDNLDSRQIMLQTNFNQTLNANPNEMRNYNGRNFFGNQNTLSQYKQIYESPQLFNQAGIGGVFTENHTFPLTPATPATPASHLNEETKNTTALSQILTIPAEGKEILLTRELIYGELKLNVFGIDQTSAFGSHQEELETNLKKLTPSPRANLVGSPMNKQANILLKKGSNKLTLAIPGNIKPSALKLTCSRSHNEFLKDIISSPLVTRFSSETPFHQPHPAGLLMAVCSYLDYLIAHKLDKPAQENLRTTASRLCAELTLSQKPDGSWSQIRNRKASSLIHTALSYQALLMASRLQVPHEKITIAKAITWINVQQKSLATNLYNSRAIVQLSLASSGDADFATCNRLYRERSKMDNIGKAILANVFVLLEKNEFTTTLLKETTGDTKVKHASEAYLQSVILLDALKLNAEIATNKQSVVKFTHHFSTDIERGIAAYSYSKYLQSIKPPASAADLTISINAKQIKDGNIPAELLRAAGNDIQIESSQDGAIVSVELIGRQFFAAQSQIKDFTVEDRKYYKEKLSYKGQALDNSGTSPVTQTEIGHTVHVHLKGKIKNKFYPDSILIEEIPAGFSYLAGSLRGNHSGARQEGNHLVITYGSLPDTFHLRYTLIAEHAGSWTHNPTLLSASYDTSKISNNAPSKLTILAKGMKDNTPYQINKNEHYELAKLHFQAKEYKQAKQHILACRKLKQTSEDPVLAQMLLWIETEQAKPDAQLLADSFEILTERNPDLVIPFDKILKVGKAYRQLEEFERSMDVYTATLEAGYSADSYVGAALEDQGKFMLSVDYQNKLWLLYPDLGEVSSSRFALTQQIYSKAPNAKSLGKNPATKKPYTERELIEMSLQQTKDFLTHTPEHELADDATFSLANALFALKNYGEVVKHTAKAIVTYKDSKHATSFRYMQALGHFWLRNYDQALKSASDVAKGNSDDKDLAAFITAQIYHAKGMPEKAIEWYKGIEKSYPDAKQSIAYFEQKSISLDEVQVLDSGDKFSFKLKYRNIKEAQFQVYRVDLMKLYLREKNLSNISDINLAGITPKYNLTTQLGTGKDFQEREKTIELPVKDDGAYLVICRGDYLHTTGLILITPLKLEVQESPAQRSIRVNISDKKSGEYIDSVHVKAIGINENKFRTGETDLRGVWQTGNISSPSTIIAKDPKGRYAFFRSKRAPLPEMNNEVEQKPNSPSSKMIDFNSNLNMKQYKLNRSNLQEYEKKRRSKGKGVEIKKARKK